MPALSALPVLPVLPIPSLVTGSRDIVASDLFDIANGVVNQVESFILGAVVVVVMGFIIWQAVRSRFALAAILVAAVVGGFVYFVVTDIGFFRDTVSETINDAPETGE